MPPISRNKRFSKAAQNSVFAQSIAEGVEDPSKLLDAIDFIEGPNGVGIVLRPVQRVIAKAIYGVAFDKVPEWSKRIPDWGKVPMWDVYREKKLRPDVTEAEYLHICFNEGRCNVDNWQDIPNVGTPYGGFNEACVFAGRRGGKLIDVNEPVPTPDGFVRNGDLKDGDKIFGEDGKVHKVVLAHPIVEEEAYRVSFDDGTSILTHSGHLWLTYDRTERRKTIRRPKVMAATAGACGCGCGTSAPSAQRNHLTRGISKGEPMPFRHGHHPLQPCTGMVRTTEEIRNTLLVQTSTFDKKPQANHAVPLPKPVELFERSLLIDPYVFGAWLGDRSKNSGEFTGVDRGIWEEVEKAGYTVTHSSTIDKAHYIRGVVPQLRELGVVQNKHIPHGYLWASKEQRLALLQGLMDTDGSCMLDGQCEFSNTNKSLAEGVYHLAASLGLKPHWSEKIPVCTNSPTGRKKCKTAYIVKWTGTLPVFRLPRKLARLPKKVKDTQNWRYIVSVEPVGKRSMRCITTDNPTGLYLFGKNFNVTHNSELVAAIAAYKLYLLLNLRSPQEYFGLVSGSNIDFTFLAQDEKGAGRLFKKLREQVNRASWFAPFLKDNNTKDLSFVSLADRDQRDINPTITVSCLPCIEENELIWSASGLVPLKEMEVGGAVPDGFGSRQRVTHKQYSEKELWALETANFRGDPLLLTSNHTCIYVPAGEARANLPYLTRRDRGGRLTDTIDGRSKIRFAKKRTALKPTEGPASGISEGDYVLFPRVSESLRKSYSLDSEAFRTKTYTGSCCGHEYTHTGSAARAIPAFAISPVMCRLWGLYLAEGSVAGSPSRTIDWDFHISEKATLAKFVQETLSSELGLPSRIVGNKSNGCRVMCNSVELVRSLKHLFGSGRAEKSIPFEALYWPVECQKALIRGWLEGDGCEGRDIGPTVSKKLAYSLFALGVQAGLRPSVARRDEYTDKRGVFHRESWYVEFCKQDRHCRFFQKIGDQEFYWSKVTSIGPSGKTGRVVDISVENTESFLTKLAAVHNCTTNAVRSPSSVFLALDEFAHFRSAKGSTSDDMYAAATPATGDFHHETREEEPTVQHYGTTFGQEDTAFEETEDSVLEFEDKNEMIAIQDSMILSISSPLKKIGKMYELHRLALDEGVASGIFTLNTSSAEMNPKLLPRFLKSEHKKNPLTFKAEYTGKFLESSESYVTERAVKECVDVQWDDKGLPVMSTARINVTRFVPASIGVNYFWGFDLGMTNDASALAIAHLEPGGPHGGIRLVYDYIDRMMVGEVGSWPGVVNGIGQQKYRDHQVLPLEDILAWLREMNKCLPCFKGATDQHGGQQLVQLLELNEIKNMELVNLTPAINSQMAYALRGYIENKLCAFPYNPKFIQELKLVELEVASKYQIRVQAPLEKGAHDDMADAAMLCAFLAQRWLIEEGNLYMDPSGLSLLMQSQMHKPPAPLLCMDGVPMQTLRVMEKLKTTEKHAGTFMGTAPISPWDRRSRGRRR
jgi:hypothetical protein